MIRLVLLLSVLFLLAPGIAGAVPTPLRTEPADNPAGPWVEVLSMPARPSLAAARDGGGLALMSFRGLIYAIKGNKTGDFYSYSLTSGEWTVLNQVPEGPGLKQVKTGAGIVTAGTRSVFVVKGNNTREFYRFDADLLSWFRAPDVPYGTSGQKVKAGDMVSAPAAVGFFCYLLNCGANEFVRFWTADTQWQRLTMPANDPTGKWTKGSFLVFDGDHTIYAHKAKYHTMWTYDMLTERWSAAAIPGMPFVGRSGRSRKSKDGACGAFYNGSIYALKGGNTQEFWRYDTATRQWAELETMPQYGTSGARRKVKGGGDMVAADSVLYALKGNKTREVWKYTVTSAPLRPGDRQPGASGSAFNDGRNSFAVEPNPVAAGFATLRLTGPPDRPTPWSLSVYDINGRVVHSSSGPQAATFRLDLRAVPDGVYFARLETGGRTAVQKLTVRRE